MKDISPTQFFRIVNSKLYGPLKPSNTQYINYLFPGDLDEVVLIGHRGGVLDYLYSENSMNNFRLSNKLGITFFEIDVLLTQDNVPVVFHDIHLERLTGEDRFLKEVYYNELETIMLRDGQKISTMSEVIKEFPNLIIDLTKNNIEDIKIIINYLFENHLETIQTTAYIQLANKDAITYIKQKNANILVTYNEWGDHINNVDKYKHLTDFFTLNPSENITKQIVQKLGKEKTIFAVVQNDNINEVLRMKNLGIKYIMIDNGLIYNRQRIEEVFK